MRNVFHSPGRGEPGSGERPSGPYYPQGNQTPEIESAEPYDGGAGQEAEPERARTGCSWLLVFIMMVAVGIIMLVSWSVREMIWDTFVHELPQNYHGVVSPLPAQKPQVPQADLQLQIYYIAHGRALVPETRRLRKPASENERLRLIAQELKQPPTGKLLENPLPPKTEINGVYLLGGIAYVDLSLEFTKVEQPTPLKERLAVYALVNSLWLNNRSIQGVQILIDGRPAITAWGWLDLSSPLGPDLSLEAPAARSDEEPQ